MVQWSTRVNKDPGFTSTGLLMKSFRGSFRADNAHGAATRRSMWTMLSWRFTRSGSLVPGVGWRMIRFHSEFSRCFAMFPTSKWPESVGNTSSSLVISKSPPIMAPYWHNMMMDPTFLYTIETYYSGQILRMLGDWEILESRRSESGGAMKTWGL